MNLFIYIYYLNLRTVIAHSQYIQLVNIIANNIVFKKYKTNSTVQNTWVLRVRQQSMYNNDNLPLIPALLMTMMLLKAVYNLNILFIF